MTTRPATPPNGFECRILLGPIHNWKAPDKDSTKATLARRSSANFVVSHSMTANSL